MLLSVWLLVEILLSLVKYWKNQKKGALTIAISNNPMGKILNFGQHKIILNTKEEVISGSTD